MTALGRWFRPPRHVLALFLGFGKRRQELVLLQDSARNHRAILGEYSVQFLDEMLNVVISAAIVAYSLYTFTAVNVPPNHMMMLTIPLPVYGLFRYLYLIHIRGETAAPDEVPRQAGVRLGPGKLAFQAVRGAEVVGVQAGDPGDAIGALSVQNGENAFSVAHGHGQHL